MIFNMVSWERATQTFFLGLILVTHHDLINMTAVARDLLIQAILYGYYAQNQIWVVLHHNTQGRSEQREG